MRKRKCPWCGKLVMLDNANRRILHEAPVCRGFEEAVRQTNGKPEGEVIIHDDPKNRS